MANGIEEQFIKIDTFKKMLDSTLKDYDCSIVENKYLSEDIPRVNEVESELSEDFYIDLSEEVDDFINDTVNKIKEDIYDELASFVHSSQEYFYEGRKFAR